jgi:hypothetical protein
MSDNGRLLTEAGVQQIDNMKKAAKSLLILERSANTLVVEKDGDGSYVLEGIFGEIGVRNKNNRIYDAKEYVPQIESLQEKIRTGKLLGELDHPQNFDISLKSVSHVIEELSYDPETKQVRGRLRLLNTSAGREAKALIDDGIPLHISSRAAGAVGSDGHVTIKKLFTYDLVADPGFENAQLNRVNESFGFADDDNVQIFELDSAMSFDKYSNIKENNDSPNMEGAVKIEDFNAYSKHLTEQINSLKAELKSVREANTTGGGDNANQIAYMNKMSQKMNEMFSYLKYTSETLDNVISHNDSLAESLQQLQGYVNHVAEKADYGIQYAEDLGKKSNGIVEYNKYLAEHVDNLAQFGDSLAEGLDDIASYTEYLKENLETVGQYGDYTAENVQKIKAKLAAVNEEDTAKEIEKKINKLGEPEELPIKKGEEVVGEEDDVKKLTNENKKDEVAEITNESTSYKNNILEKLNLLVESAKKQTVDYDGDLHFLRLVNESKRNEYKSLNENQQFQLIGAFKDKNYTSTREVEVIWENVMNPQPKKINFVENMPSEYRASWDAANQLTKNRIIAEAQWHDLGSQYLIDTFWSTRDFRNNQVQLEKVNESEAAKFETTQGGYGVSAEFLNGFAADLAKRFGKY